MRFTSISCLTFLAAVVAAADVISYETYGVGGQTFFACADMIQLEATFGDEDIYGSFCSNINAMATIAGCFAYRKRNTTGNYKYMRSYCQKYYMTPVTMENLTHAYEYYVENAVLLEDIPDYNISVPVNSPIKVNDTAAKLFEDAYVVFLGNYDDSLYYGAGCIGYWGLISIIAMVFNWGSVLFPSLRNFFNGQISKLARKYILLPALVRKRKASPQKFLFVLDFLLPSRVESLVVFLFFWLVFILNAVGIYYVDNDPVFQEDKWQAIHRYVADRTGIVCTVLIPLLVLFGGRNNFLQFLTRWKYSTLMVYHRWIARMVVLMAVIHSIAFTQLLLADGASSYYSEMAESYLIWGTVGTTCGALICFQGLLFLRRRWYESFLVIHILLAIFFVVGTWYHIWELGYAQIMYPVFAIWFFDRVVRVGRLLAFGFPKAKITLLADETLKVETPKPKYWHATPGGHAWIYFGAGFYFWQSHPFTFVETSDTTLTFFCKSKGGITNSLYKKLVKIPGKSITMRVGVEGPYGESHPIKHHSNVVFVAGGNGIPGLYNELKDLVKHNDDGKQILKFVWMIRELKTLTWFYNELQALKSANVETTIYVTRSNEVAGTEDLLALISNSDSDSNKDKDEKVYSTEVFDLVTRDMPHINFVEGRPSLEMLVASEIGEAATSVAFVTCGHPTMVDDLRYLVVNSLEKTTKRVDFYDALEVWA